MCRIGLLVNCDTRIAASLGSLYAFGANNPPVIKSWRNADVVHCRFDVTSANTDNNSYPLESERYLFNYNGEVYGVGEALYSNSGFATDNHFALNYLERLGLEEFLERVDFQGTYCLVDKANDVAYIIVDQLNTAGCFWAKHNDTIIVAQESAVMKQLISEAGLPDDTPIDIVKNGCYLKIHLNKLTVKETCYRPVASEVWGAPGYDKHKLILQSASLATALYKSCIARIPKQGPVAVMCSGGLDSGLLLFLVANHLRAVYRIQDLRVFTFDDSSISAQSDLAVCLKLMRYLDLDKDQYLTIIPEEEQVRDHLYSEYVFGEQSRLVTPNPVLNTQVRHTVRMSQVLAYIVHTNPDIKCILSGDGADEVFAGYNSMRLDVGNKFELTSNIREKLNDFALNDASRVTLSCYFGTSAVLTYKNSKQVHPVEVRMPFTSHKVLEAVRDSSAGFITGNLNNKVASKFLLRIAAKISGVPEFVYNRKKLAFNEGGGSVPNSEADPLELKVAKKFAIRKEDCDLPEDLPQRLGLEQSQLNKNSAQYTVLQSAAKRGLTNLLAGNVFRAAMPDTIYSSNEEGSEFGGSVKAEFNTEELSEIRRLLPEGLR